MVYKRLLGRSTIQRRRIESGWFKNRSRFKDLNAPLPHGWTRHEASDQPEAHRPHLYPNGCGKYVYQHCNLLHEKDNFWYYPFPVAEVQASTVFCVPEQTLYIFCETRKARLWAHQVTSRKEGGEILHLRDQTCNKIGMLHPHNHEQRQNVPEKIARNELGKPIDLVAIYRSRFQAKTWDEESQRYTHPIRVWEEYAVLWVMEEN